MEISNGRIFYLTALLFICISNAAQVTLEWATRYENRFDYSASITIDKSGYVYVTGRTNFTSGSADCVTIK